MNKLVRDALFISFVILFIFLTTIFSMSAAGYRLDIRHPFSTRFLQKTGTMILDSTPNGATIYLDGRTKNSSGWFSRPATTPAKIKNLLPGEYTLRIELPNYLPWEKKLKILPGQNTFAEKINLFKESRLEKINEAEALTIKDGRLTNRLENSEEINNLQKKIGKNANDFKIDGYQTYYRLENNISSLNTKTDQVKIVWNESNEKKVLDYLPSDGELFLAIKEKSGAITLESINQNGQINFSINLPAATNYLLDANENGFIIAHNPSSRIAYIFDRQLQPAVREPLKDVSFWAFVSSNRILIAGEFEISYYDFNTGTRSLITRIDEGMTGFTFNKKGNYLIYSTRSAIKSFDLNEESWQSTELIKAENAKDLKINEKDKTLYFKQEDAWYKIILQ